MLPESLTPEVMKQIEVLLSIRDEEELQLAHAMELVAKELRRAERVKQ